MYMRPSLLSSLLSPENVAKKKYNEDFVMYTNIHSCIFLLLMLHWDRVPPHHRAQLHTHRNAKPLKHSKNMQSTQDKSMNQVPNSVNANMLTSRPLCTRNVKTALENHVSSYLILHMWPWLFCLSPINFD